MSTLNAPVPADPRLDTRIEQETGAPTPPSPKRRGPGGSVWWRHALGILALMWALFPILFIYSAATNPSGTLNTASLWPSGFSTKNFTDLFNDSSRPFWTWYKNSMVISLGGALLAVFLGACAAFAFSRLRFKGRRPGMMFLLLTTFFPALLAIVATYIIFAGIGDVLPSIGLNTTSGLDPRLPRWRARRQRVAAQGLLRHGPAGSSTRQRSSTGRATRASSSR